MLGPTLGGGPNVVWMGVDVTLTKGRLAYVRVHVCDLLRTRESDEGTPHQPYTLAWANIGRQIPVPRAILLMGSGDFVHSLHAYARVIESSRAPGHARASVSGARRVTNCPDHSLLQLTDTHEIGFHSDVQPCA